MAEAGHVIVTTSSFPSILDDAARRGRRGAFAFSENFEFRGFMLALIRVVCFAT